MLIPQRFDIASPPDPPPAPRSIHDEFVERRRRLGNSSNGPQDARRFREFFYELDYQSYPGNCILSDSVPIDAARQRTARFRALTAALLHRIYQRAFLAQNGTYGWSALDGAPDREALAEASKLMIGIVGRYFCADDGSLRSDALERAFEKFAGGELRGYEKGSYSECQPDSGLYFGFAEFAFLAVEAGVDRGFWLARLNLFVRSAEIFVRSYPPTDAQRTNASLLTKFDTNNNYRGPLPEDLVGQIRERYRGLALFGLDAAFRWVLGHAVARGRIDEVALRSWPNAAT